MRYAGRGGWCMCWNWDWIGTCSLIWGPLGAPIPKTALSSDVLNCKREIPTVGVESRGLLEHLFFHYDG